MFTTSQVARTKMPAAALFGVAIVSTALTSTATPALALGECGPNAHRGFWGGCRFGGQNQAWCLRNTGHVAAFVQVFSRRQRKSHHALRRPAAEKRQGTKSREVGHWLAASPMGILISAPTSFAGERPTRRVHRLV